MTNDLNKTRVSEAISIAAHQLKTPISVVKSYIEVLLSGDLGLLNDKQSDYLKDVMENVKRMSILVNQLLEISRLDQGRYELAPEEFSLPELTKEIVNGFLRISRAYNAVLTVNFDANLPAAFADRLKIRQVIENLISNALKYKEAGPGKIEIYITEKNGQLLFSCKDNGIGISEEDKDKIFSKFYRSEKAVELDPNGTGLGLYINREIINLSGGKIWLEENPNKGLTFCFILPIKK
jgi:signal transduction histidine kinase